MASAPPRKTPHGHISNLVTVLCTSVRIEADCVGWPQVLGYSGSASHAFSISSGRDAAWLLIELMSIGYNRVHFAQASRKS
jgi:hypothetical protein